MYKRCFLLLPAALVTVLVVGSVVMAQDQDQNQRRRFPGLRNQLLRLLQAKEVIGHLDLNEKQQAAVKQITEEANSDRPRLRLNLQNQSEEARAKMQAERQQQFQEIKKSLAGALSEKQMSRLSELHLQSQGIAAMEEDPEIAAKLKITDEQKQAIAKILSENAQKMRTAFQEARDSDDRAAAGEKFAALREEAEKALLGVLTKEQQAALEKLKGEKFDLPQLRGGGRRSRGQNNDS